VVQALDKREKGAVGEAGGFLGELSGTEIFTPDHRLKSYHYHKTLEGIGALGDATEDLNDGETGVDPEALGEGLDVKGAILGVLPNPMDALDPMAGSVNKGMGDNPRQLCKAASTFLGKLAYEQNFGAPHREEAGLHAKALTDLASAPDEDDPPAEEGDPGDEDLVGEGEALAAEGEGLEDKEGLDEDGMSEADNLDLDNEGMVDDIEDEMPEPGEMDTKSLAAIAQAQAEQQKQIGELARTIGSLVGRVATR
jgi:hypothetical protein